MKHEFVVDWLGFGQNLDQKRVVLKSHKKPTGWGWKGVCCFKEDGSVFLWSLFGSTNN